MTEEQYREVERVLLCIGDAKARAAKAHDAVQKDGADAHVTNEEEVWEAVKIIQPRLLSLMERLIPALPSGEA